MNSRAGSTGPSPSPPGGDEPALRGTGGALSRYADWLAGLSWKRFVAVAALALIGAGILSSLPPFDIPWGPDRHVLRTPDRAARELRDIEVRVENDGIRISRRAPASAPSVGASDATPPRVIEIPLPAGVDRDDVREAIDDATAELREEASGEPRLRVVKAFTPGDYLPQAMLLLIVASIIAKVMGVGRRKAEARAAEATEAAEGEALKRQVVEARMAAMQAQVEPHFLFNTLASIDHLIETDSARASRMQKNLIALLRASMPTMRETAAAGAPRDLERELAVVRPYLEILKMRMEERLAVGIDIPDGLLSAEFPPMMMQSLVENAVKHGLEPKADGGALSLKAEIVHGKLALTVADTGLGFGKSGSAGAGPLPSQPTPPRGAASEASVGASAGAGPLPSQPTPPRGAASEASVGASVGAGPLPSQPTPPRGAASEASVGALSTAGTGVGLANIRERLQLLYGAKASLTVTQNKPSGTVATITVPYVSHAKNKDGT